MSFYQIKKILIAVDLSETSLNALETGISIAAKHQAEINLLYVHDNSMEFYPSDDNDFSLKSVSQSSLDILNALAGSIQKKNNITPVVITDEGPVTPCIIKQSILSQSDLIVLGTSGASGYRDGFIGTNAYRVIKHAICPVLMVPPHKKWRSFKQILFPIRPVSGALSKYDVVCNFSNASSNLHILGLSNRSEDNETKLLNRVVEEIKEELTRDKLQTRVSWSNGKTIADGILSSAIENNTDLIVVTAALDVTTKQNFTGPHTQKILNCAKVPVLSIKKAAVPYLIN